MQRFIITRASFSPFEPYSKRVGSSLTFSLTFARPFYRATFLNTVCSFLEINVHRLANDAGTKNRGCEFRRRGTQEREREIYISGEEEPAETRSQGWIRVKATHSGKGCTTVTAFACFPRVHSMRERERDEWQLGHRGGTQAAGTRLSHYSGTAAFELAGCHSLSLLLCLARARARARLRDVTATKELISRIVEASAAPGFPSPPFAVSSFLSSVRDESSFGRDNNDDHPEIHFGT